MQEVKAWTGQAIPPDGMALSARRAKSNVQTADGPRKHFHGRHKQATSLAYGMPDQADRVAASPGSQQYLISPKSQMLRSTATPFSR